jgi:catechol 2,3-dioxygenase-like lactoylglutathione lyase family enzyme
MFTHICIAAQDLDAARTFYDAALTPLGVQSIGPISERSLLYKSDHGTLLVMTPANGEPATASNGGTIGFAGADAAAIDAFHAAGIANGGTDEGAPGIRAGAGPNAYGAYLRDPTGNKICAFCQLATNG